MELKMFYLRCLVGQEGVDKNSTGCCSSTGGTWDSKWDAESSRR